MLIKKRMTFFVKIVIKGEYKVCSYLPLLARLMYSAQSRGDEMMDYFIVIVLNQLVIGLLT